MGCGLGQGRKNEKYLTQNVSRLQNENAAKRRRAEEKRKVYRKNVAKDAECSARQERKGEAEALAEREEERHPDTEGCDGTKGRK